MDSVPFDFRCASCGCELRAAGWSSCALCGGSYCHDHLVTNHGVSTCASCVAERKRLETASGVSAEELARVVMLISADVEATVGSGLDDVVVEAAARRRIHGDATSFTGLVVDDVQQYLHDTFVDTTWPACPHHVNHPLWFSDGWWQCEQSGARIARLGHLPSRRERE